MAAINRRRELVKKKFALLSYPSHIEARMPDNLLPIEVLKNQPPIIKDVRRGGLNLDTKLKPMGLKNNSPIVMTL